jgi:hypothetical protein
MKYGATDAFLTDALLRSQSFHTTFPGYGFTTNPQS